MDRNEFFLRTTEIILNDWRKVLLANEETKHRVNLPGDTCDISLRAMQRARELTNEFFTEKE